MTYIGFACFSTAIIHSFKCDTLKCISLGEIAQPIVSIWCVARRITCWSTSSSVSFHTCSMRCQASSCSTCFQRPGVASSDLLSASSSHTNSVSLNSFISIESLVIIVLHNMASLVVYSYGICRSYFNYFNFGFRKNTQQETVDGSRCRRRLHTSWKDNIKEWTGQSTSSLRHTADNRNRWHPSQQRRLSQNP